MVPTLIQPMTAVALTNAMELDEVVSRLAQHDAVDGIMLLGSTGTDALTPTSDYDLLLVLTELPVPMRIVNTWIDNRLTEVYCTTVDAIERIMANDATWSDGSEEATVLVWLNEGRIVHDRAGRLAIATRTASSAAAPTVSNERAIHEAWRTIGYNVAQIKRYLIPDDPISQTTVDMRLLYSVAEVNLHYFTVRRLPWRGEKPAIGHWMAHDTGYLGCLHRYVDETDRRRKVALYEELAELALAPVGGLWMFGETVISIGDGGYGAGPVDPSSGTSQDALDFWQRLVADRHDGIGTL